ncbi:NAD(P)-dependent oxidoreductase [Kutzneria chonburiensis]|uniref:NAD(P)-dependent oxidoreductase n=1 Tax=Kutzneria chonburiensis TaxID=1483604 RepID=UPI00235DC7C1|nr:NAD(P)-binding oxidoreductase [Kutzneria chonburiensis]
MNLIVLAASGRTGLALTRQALRRGHTVTAIARDPERIALPDSPTLRKVTGDVGDPAGIAAVVDAHSVVLSGLGTEQAGTLLAGAKAVVAAGPRRIIWLGAYGTGRSADAAGEGAAVLGKLLGDRLADKVEADNTVLAAGGTVFHAGVLDTGPESHTRRTVGLAAAPRSTSRRRSAARPSPRPCSTRPRRPVFPARSPFRWIASRRRPPRARPVPGHGARRGRGRSRNAGASCS